MDEVFEILGYHVDLYKDNKYVGSIKIKDKDRHDLGYAGRREEYVCGNVRRGNKIVFVEGMYTTECVPLCGKIKADRYKVLENAHEWRNIVCS